MTKGHYAIYGNLTMGREYCIPCKTMALIIKGNFGCCDRPCKQTKSVKQKVEVQARRMRKQPSANEKHEIIENQDNKCIYCEIVFGEPYWSPCSRRTMTSYACFDHLVPFSYSYNNHKVNFVASCNICNSIKSNKMFNTLEEARNYVRYNRKKKGYQTYQEVVMQDLWREDIPK